MSNPELDKVKRIVLGYLRAAKEVEKSGEGPLSAVASLQDILSFIESIEKGRK